MSLLRDTLEADLYRGRRAPAFWLRLVALVLFGRGQRGCIALLRLAQAFDRHRLRFFAQWCAAQIERRYGCYIHLHAKLGPGLKLPHPTGIVVGEGVALGARCTIYQHVTIGGRRVGDWATGNYPRIGDDVVMFCGAVVIGAIDIGDHVTIGANSVVLHSVPPSCSVAGAPARVISDGAALARRA